MTTHDIPSRRRRTALIAGASVALGLVASVLLQFSSSDDAPAPTAVDADAGNAARTDCPAVVVL